MRYSKIIKLIFAPGNSDVFAKKITTNLCVLKFKSCYSELLIKENNFRIK